jgi:hypothetical protein
MPLVTPYTLLDLKILISGPEFVKKDQSEPDVNTAQKRKYDQ